MHFLSLNKIILLFVYSFIAINLIYAILQVNALKPWDFVADNFQFYGGMTVIAIAALLTRFKRCPSTLPYDCFATGTLLVWFPYWYPDFVEDSPVFLYFPLYFALMTATLSLLLIRKNEMDVDTKALMMWLSDSGRFNPILIAVFVLLGLYLKQHFMLYPIAMTLFVLRFTMAENLRSTDSLSG